MSKGKRNHNICGIRPDWGLAVFQEYGLKYDRDLKDIFVLQDDITIRILTALEVNLTKGEQARLWGKGTANLDAYESILQAFDYTIFFTNGGNFKARQLAEEAVILDPKYTTAYWILSYTHLPDV